jgi:hypothetical protein
MSQTSLDRFLQTALRDARLQEQLWREPDTESFFALAQRLAAEQDEHFIRADIAARLNMSRHEWRERGALATAKANLDGWIPIRIGWRGDQAIVEWCYAGERRFSDPFFDQTVGACLRHPFNKLVRYQAPIDSLAELDRERPRLPPAGFIFHMSRCGSTLVAQLLASLPQASVLAEAQPIDAVLRARFHYADISDEQRRTWLRWVVEALGRRQAPQQQALFIKFDSWNIIDLPLIEQVFPGVPWLFVFRDPVEVMVSHQKLRGSQMIPGMIEPDLLGLDLAEIPPHALDEYCARTLASICQAAVQSGQEGDGLFINYRQLPAIVWSSLLDFFGVVYTESDVDRMRHIAQFHAKNPSAPFGGDTSAKQQAATDELRRLADQWVQPHYRQLLELQRS